MQENAVAGKRFVHVQQVLDLPGLDSLTQPIGGHAWVETGVKPRTRGRLQYDPGLRLADGRGALQLAGLGIVWVDLDGKRITGMDELEQEWESAVRRNDRPDDSLRVLFHQMSERRASPRTFD